MGNNSRRSSGANSSNNQNQNEDTPTTTLKDYTQSTPEDEDVGATPDSDSDETRTNGGVAGVGGAIAGAAVPTGSDPSADETDDGQVEDEATPEDSEAETEHEDDGKDAVADDPQEDLEFNSVEILVATDPWDPVSWQMEPTYKRLKRVFGGNVTVVYVPLPPRHLDNESVETCVGPMPSSNWSGKQPADTTLSAQALAAALELGYSEYRRLLRRLRIAVHGQGIDIEDRTQLAQLAQQTDLDYHEFRSEFPEVELDDPDNSTPQTIVKAGDVAVPWSEYVSPDAALSMSVISRIEPDPIQILGSKAGFVRQFSLSATPEIAIAYDCPATDVEAELARSSDIECRDYGGTHYWQSPSKGDPS